jgi:cyanophycin synthetase
VPAAGAKVLIQRNGNVAFDCTDEVHPETAAAPALAARVVGLDIAGIDLVAEDISKPLAAQGGAIVEVNAGPGLLMHLKPASASRARSARPSSTTCFPPTTSGRIPIVGVAGTQRQDAVARLVAWLLHLSGRRVGLACSDGLFLDRLVEKAATAPTGEPASAC